MFKKVADSVLVPEFTPRSGVKVQISDAEPVDNSGAGKCLRLLFSCDKFYSPFDLKMAATPSISQTNSHLHPLSPATA